MDNDTNEVDGSELSEFQLEELEHREKWRKHVWTFCDMLDALPPDARLRLAVTPRLSDFIFDMIWQATEDQDAHKALLEEFLKKSHEDVVNRIASRPGAHDKT